jgi:hypothetical protein
MRVEIENAAAGFSAAKVSLADSFTRWLEGIITSSAVPSRYDDLACISAERESTSPKKSNHSDGTREDE